MAFLYDTALDAGLAPIIANGTRIDICSQEPTTYAEATSTYSLGSKTGLTMEAVEDDTSGRRTQSPAITDGAVTGTGTATHWALTNGSDTLIAANSLSASQAVTSGNEFALPQFDINLTDAVSE